jgi:hypothetical protein
MRLVARHMRGTQWIPEHGALRSLLSLHDFAQFAATVCGALAAGVFV